MPRTRPALSLRIAALALAVCACSNAEPGAGTGPEPAPDAAEKTPGLSPNAMPEMVQELRAARDAERHASDGGGRAWLEDEDGAPPVAVAGAPGRFSVVYEVGPEGIAAGGAIHFQVSPFWDWSTPQIEWEDAPGYTTVTPLDGAADAGLETQTLDQQLLGIRVTGRALEPGERIRIVYGAGPAGANADRYAERSSRFWIAVDGDGDGVRAFLPDSPGVEVRPRGPARFLVTAPTIVRPDESFRLSVAVLDVLGNAGVDFEGEIALDAPPGIVVPERVIFEKEHRGVRVVSGVARTPGLYRIGATGPDDAASESNPVLVTPDGPRIFWGDLHGHSAFSDGTGHPADYFRYARDVAALDVAALTDHDHWGILPLDENPGRFSEIGEQVRRFHEPGRFVTIAGYEWTSWLHGHRHVLFFEPEEAEVLSSIDEAYESPRQLWDALEGKQALTFAHHSAGGPIATNWDIPPDPRFEPVTEIVSVHGSSEALDSPRLIYSPVPGNFVRDVLDRGYVLGFLGSGDTHDGHPGLGHLAAPSGGLAAILAEDLTRESVLAALRERRVYATSGPRILLRTALDEHGMGARIDLAEDETLTASLFVRVVAPQPLERIELVRSGEIVDALAVEGRRDVAVTREIAELRAGEYVYVRAVQEDGHAAWSSPIFLRRAP